MTGNFRSHIKRWGLVPDGDPISTHSSDLLPALKDGVPVMLKIARVTDERLGARLMEWWGGQGAARVIEIDGDALLMERATGRKSLNVMVRNGEDDEATRILCSVAAELHAPRGAPLQSLVPLSHWFGPLWPMAERHRSLAEAAATAKDLLANQGDVSVLHGDIHHGNVLDFGRHGWLAIDPKGLIGERTFDFVNILRNPETGVALAPGRFGRQASAIAEAAGLDRTHLLRWTVAFTGLSAAWILGGGGTPDADMAIAELAKAELKRQGEV
jgi:streptomycin 6-kinase